MLIYASHEGTGLISFFSHIFHALFFEEHILTCPNRRTVILSWLEYDGDIVNIIYHLYFSDYDKSCFLLWDGPVELSSRSDFKTSSDL